MIINWRQFLLLVLINAFVGVMIGMERSILPLLAKDEFGVVSATATLSFLVSFGLVKAFANLWAGLRADAIGRKPLLLLGWLAGAPVPLLLMYAPSWNWVVAANVLLGINQGLAWSMTVVMKVDLIGPKRRGLAMGLNEFAGYAAVSGAAALTGYLAGTYGLRPWPFVIGIASVLAGGLLSALAVKETKPPSAAGAPPLALGDLLSKRLLPFYQAGFVNNLNDGMVWGLIPMVLASQSVPIGTIGLVAGVYPLVWSLGQLVTGPLSDRIGRKRPIVWGMLLQAGAIALFTVPYSQALWISASALLGVGTALVYPTLLAGVADIGGPERRGSTVGMYRLWRDLGYAGGGLVTGVAVDLLGAAWAIGGVAVITALSGLMVAVAGPEPTDATVVEAATVTGATR